MKITDILNQEELKQVTAKSDLQAAWMVMSQWVMVIGIFWVVAAWTNPLTVIVGTILMGGRHLGFGVLGHECGHKTLFKTRWLNSVVADWLLTPPRFGNNASYMRGHLQHHRLAGTEQDPDIRNYRDYPITRQRLRRKIKRDLTGQTGWREVKGIWGRIVNIHKLPRESRDCLLRGIFANTLIIGIPLAMGEPWLVFVWVVSYVFIHPFISRVRQVAEHGAVPDLYDLDPRKNTRTVLPSLIERMVFAPHRVSYHLEHHMLASVPAYRLKKLHRILTDKGYYDGVDFPRGYLDLLRKVTVPTPASAAA